MQFIGRRGSRTHSLSLESLESRLLLSSATIEGQIAWDAGGTAGEVPVPGAEVYLDANENGSRDQGEEVQWTDLHGNYSFEVEPGTHKVGQVLPDEWEQETPQQATQTITVADGETASDVDFLNSAPLDFGDLPDSYGTTLADNGPRHIVGGYPFGELYLGQNVDSEADAETPLDGTGDGADEDGVLFTGYTSQGETAHVTVTASAGGRLDAWVDWDGSGSFEAADEQIFASQWVDAGENDLSFQVPRPDNLPEEIHSRWRLSSHGGLAPTGPAMNGEVEDVRLDAAPDLAQIATHDYGGMRVTIYDGNPANGISDPEIAWTANGLPWSVSGHDDIDVMVLPSGNNIRAILLRPGQSNGGQPDEETRDLGFAIEGNGVLGAFVDQRTSPSPLSFLVSEGWVNRVDIKSSMAGANINGLSLPGGWELPEDMDGDVNLQDPTSFYSTGKLLSFATPEDIGGDVLAGGNIGRVIAGSPGGGPPAFAQQSNGTEAAIAGDVRTPAHINLIYARGGDITGDVEAGGKLNQLRTHQGSVAGDVTVGGNLNVLMARRGDISGDVTVDGNLNVMKAIHGDITGTVDVGGRLNVALAIPRGQHEGGGIPGDITVGRYAHVIKALGGDVGNVTVEQGSLHVLMARDGDITGDVDVAGSLHVMQVHGGDLQGDLTVNDDLHSLRVIEKRGGGGSIEGTVDVGSNAHLISARGGNISGNIDISGTLHLLRIHGGDLSGSFEAANVNLIHVIGGEVSGSIDVSNRLRRLVVTKGRGKSGGINLQNSEQIRAGNRIGLIKVRGGDIVGDGDASEPDILVRHGNLGKIQVVQGSLNNVSVKVTRDNGSGGSLGSVRVVGGQADITGSHLEADNVLGSVGVVHGDMVDTTIQANELGRVRVTHGEIYDDDSDQDPDEIHANEGTFYIRDRHWEGRIYAGKQYDFGGVLAHVG